MKDLISVVIPCFNSGSTLKKAIDSVKSQTWNSVEIILIDDGSNDSNTLEIIDSIINIEVIKTKNQGLSAARNVGISASNGKYILLLDSDDWLEPDAIEKLLSKLKKSHPHSFSYSLTQLEGERQGVISRKYNFFEQLFLNQVPYSILISKKLIIQCGGYDEQMINGFEDWDLNIRLGLNNIYGVVVNAPLFHYRVSKNGMLLSKSANKHAHIWGYIQQKYQQVYSYKKLLLLWLLWRKKESRYPLSYYFIAKVLYDIFPKPMFQKLLSALRVLKKIV